jgi:hypothetical protein
MIEVVVVVGESSNKTRVIVEIVFVQLIYTPPFLFLLALDYDEFYSLSFLLLFINPKWCDHGPVFV